MLYHIIDTLMLPVNLKKVCFQSRIHNPDKRMGENIQEWTKSRMDQVKASLPQILLGPFLNILSYIR